VELQRRSGHTPVPMSAISTGFEYLVGKSVPIITKMSQRKKKIKH
jgi:hypothetical protein